MQIGAPIDAGAFGQVFLGTDDVHGEVAVKRFHQHPGEADAEWANRKAALLQEGQRLSQAAHPNVVQVHYLVESDNGDAMHLVMEYCSGGSLQAAFENGPLPLLEVRRLATQMSLGLDAIHGRGMLHRDIKPANALLSAATVVKISDFGLVTDNLVLGYGSQAGYSDHIAREVWLGAGTSVRSDVWALGMTIYRLIHGAEWYSRLKDDPGNVIRDGGFAASLPWLPHVPDGWRRVVRKMMHDDPHHRYQNAHEVMNALAGLSTEPNWTCEVTPDEIRWLCEIHGRKRIVVWTRYSERRHEWRAWSEPNGAGRKRTLSGSEGIVSYSTSERQLKDFFSA